jgi:P27 family predicted phage terminase small subunit
MKKQKSLNTIPENPIRISTEGRVIFEKLYPVLLDSERFTPGDEYNLTLLCEALADYDDCREILNREGKFYQSGTMQRVHPAWTAQMDIIKTIKDLSAGFLLSPKHRHGGEGIPSSMDPMEAISKTLRDAN